MKSNQQSARGFESNWFENGALFGKNIQPKSQSDRGSSKKWRWLSLILVIVGLLFILRNVGDGPKSFDKASAFVEKDSAPNANKLDVAEDVPLSDSEKQQLAIQFAPNLYFDNDMRQYPMNAQQYLDSTKWRGVNLGLKGHSTEVWNANIGETTTYYIVTECGSHGQVRINYYWFYGYQPLCVVGSSMLEVLGPLCALRDECGYHRGDWEHVMVTLSLDRKKMAAVTYWAHGDSMTRIWKDIPVAPNGRAIVYVGKLQHGSYPESEHRGSMTLPPGFSESCNFFADWRNNDGDAHRFDIQKTPQQLIHINHANPPAGQGWMRDPTFCDGISESGHVRRCGISSKPAINNDGTDFCAVKMCKKSDACSVASCLSYQDKTATMQCTSWIDGSVASQEQHIPQTDFGLLPARPPDGTLFRCSGQPQVYFQMHGEKRHVSTWSDVTRLWGSNADSKISKVLAMTYCNHIPTGPSLGSHAKLVVCDGHYFLQTAVDTKSWICDQASLVAFKFEVANKQDLTHAECRKSCNRHWLCVDPAKRYHQRAAIDKLDSCIPHIEYVSTKQIASDRGSDADLDLVIWGASSTPHGCAPLATIANRGGNGGAVPCMYGAEDDDYAKPTHYAKIWVDWGSGNHNDYSLWAPVCPHGFVTLSGAENLDVYGGNHASNLDFQEVYCVATKHAAVSTIGHYIWSDRGTGASQDGSVWGINGGYWAASPNHGHPGGTFYRLDMKPLGATWRWIGGGMKHVSMARNGDIWGVTTTGKIFRSNYDVANHKFVRGWVDTSLPGGQKAVVVSVGGDDGELVMAIGENSHIYAHSNNAWTSLMCCFIDVSVDTGIARGVAGYHWLWQQHGAFTSGHWSEMPQSCCITQISVNKHWMAGLGADKNPYYWSNGWHRISLPGNLQATSVGAAPDYTIWATDIHHGIWYKLVNTWLKVVGGLKQIHAASAWQVIGINAGGDLWILKDFAN